MAEVDTSSYGKGPAPINPLQTLSGVAGLQNTLNTNKLFQQEYNSKLGLSQIYRQAIDPQTGQLDPQKLNQLMADPQASANVSLGLPQAYQQSQEAQKRNIGINQDQYNLLKDHLNTLTGYLGPLAAGNPTANDVAATIGHAITTGVATPKEGADMWATLPRDGQGNVDPAQIKPWALQNLQRVQAAGAQYGITNPAPAPVGTGGQTHLLVTPQNGPARDVGQIANTLPPTTSTVGPGNVPQALGPVNSQLQVPGQPAPAAGGAPPPTPAPAAAAPPGGPGPTAPQAAPAPTGPVQTGLAPGVAEAQTVAAHGSAAAYQSLRNDVGQSATRIFQLGKALTGLQGAPTGPGTETVNHIASFLQAQSPESLKAFLPGVDVNQIKNRDEADKYLQAYASGQAGSFAPHTDSQLATALSSNASTHISNLAAQDVVKANIGLERMKQAQATAFQNSGLPPEKFSDWAVDWNKTTDPRAFIVDQMTPQERTAMITKMKPAEQKNFLNSFRHAVATGVVSMSDLAPQSGK